MTQTAPLDPTIDDFLAERDFAPATEKSYRRYLRQFLDSTPDPQAATAKTLRAWLTDKNWSNNTQHLAFIAITSYIRWRFGESHPLLRMKLKIIDPPAGRSLTLDQVNQLLATFDTATPKGRRDLAICCLFIDSALRVSEMCHIELARLDLMHQTGQAFVKGRKWRSYWYSPYTANLLTLWLAERPTIARPDCKTVFCSLGGTKPGAALTREGLQHEVAKWGERIGIELSPHDFRRTFGNETTRSGAPQKIAMAAGGWKSESAFRRYTLNLRPNDIAAYSPIMAAMGLAPEEESKKTW